MVVFWILFWTVFVSFMVSFSLYQHKRMSCLEKKVKIINKELFKPNTTFIDWFLNDEKSLKLDKKDFNLLLDYLKLEKKEISEKTIIQKKGVKCRQAKRKHVMNDFISSPIY